MWMSPACSKALVSGEALPGAFARQFSGRGIDVYQCYATADLGVIAYETEAREGLVVDGGIYLEIVRPEAANPLLTERWVRSLSQSQPGLP